MYPRARNYPIHLLFLTYRMGENGQEYTQNQPMTLKIQTTIKKSSPNGISQPSPFKDEFKCGAFHRHKKRTVKKKLVHWKQLFTYRKWRDQTKYSDSSIFQVNRSKYHAARENKEMRYRLNIKSFKNGRLELENFSHL